MTPLKGNLIASLISAAFWGLVVKVATAPFLGDASFLAAAVTMVVCYCLAFVAMAYVQAGADPEEVEG